MNNTQRAIATVGLILVILMGVYPPWEFALDDRVRNVGYSFIGDPPIMEPPQRAYVHATIDLDRLAIQWITTLIATIGFVKVCKRKK